MKTILVLLSLFLATVAHAGEKEVRFRCDTCANENPPVTHFLLLRGPWGDVEGFESTVTDTVSLGLVAPGEDGVYRISLPFYVGEHQIGVKAVNGEGPSLLSNLRSFVIEPPPAAVPEPVTELRVD